MKRSFFVCAIVLLLFSSCAQEFNRVSQSTDQTYRYEYAKECFVMGQYHYAEPLLRELISVTKGTDNAQECLFLLAMTEYKMEDYPSAAEVFKKYIQTYPNGYYAEKASFYIGESLYQDSPEPRLDQAPTLAAIAAYQEYMDLFPNGKMRKTAQTRMFQLQDKLVRKEYLTAKLYYNLGSYFGNCTYGGNNYEACIITSQNALNDYPYSSLRKDFAILIMKSKFELAEISIEEKAHQRYQDAEDECYGFINEYPDAKERVLADKLIAKCKKILNTEQKVSSPK